MYKNTSIEEIQDQLLTRSFTSASTDIEGIMGAFMKGTQYSVFLSFRHPRLWGVDKIRVMDIGINTILNNSGFQTFERALDDLGLEVQTSHDQPIILLSEWRSKPNRFLAKYRNGINEIRLPIIKKGSVHPVELPLQKLRQNLGFRPVNHTY